MAKCLNHIAFIMDGNRRWAKKNKCSAMHGYEAGFEKMLEVVDLCAKMNLKYASFYSFSKENWFRSIKELYGIFYLIEKHGKQIIERWSSADYKVRIVGDKCNLPYKVKNWADELEEKTQNCTGLNVSLVVNYSGRDDIVKAIVKIIDKKNENINESIVSQNLYTSDIPDPDLCIRTGGESRLSNFFLWQMAYTEISFVDIFWPDFSEDNLNNLMKNCLSKDKRWGV
ncbi:di-trans,poly-cis-decaprenylcistransferase [Candidatus Cytomitobacter indipagum]|uniref:Isoprenyl transferase n=1 Tax=Candidatus Cytomitobacter indipagum TaxID=2601575 RepID=A0A5C0UCV7_9PROT|nr:polyprenyl diphosphate synthase [Candidatus Cytomitobacter indipagum]QEK37856.1 di-trans,poly-cis-decaprenylcistransferase [Candidatus Cytomitobacter indipagum]